MRAKTPATDLIGRTFHQLTVIAADGEGSKKARCRCTCGNEIFVVPHSVRTGHTKSCGCRQTAYESLVGKTFNKLTILDLSGAYPNNARCRCVCGRVIHASPYKVRTGHTKSCGCGKTPAASLIGQRSGSLTVIAADGQGAKKLRCRCDCGSEIFLTVTYFRTGHTKSCGCSRHRVDSFIGTRFNRLVPTEVVNIENRNLLRCTCDCGREITTTHNKLMDGHTKSCGCLCIDDNGSSAPENELRSYLASLTEVSPQRHLNDDRWSYDIILPQQRIVVEYNGLYWHSYPRRNAGFHRLKRLHAEAAGYRLINIWEDQWRDQTDIIKNYLHRIVTGPATRMGARQCEVGSVSPADAGAFHAAHHIQGRQPTQANIHIGLTHKGVVKAVASFDKKGVLHRYTTAYTAIAGGLSKIIAASLFQHVTTYCDRDHFTGAVYGASGFTLTGTTTQMTYVEGHRRVWRGKFMRHKLPDLFGTQNCDMNLTERDICAANRVFACYNSGVDRWEWRR